MAKASAADEFDYVIVGSGAAGSVLANRLTEDAGVTVCVLEAGPPDYHPYIHLPAGFIKMLFNPGFTWQFKTEPGEYTGGRAIPTTQGRTLGGTSSINGMIYNRGQRADCWQPAHCSPISTPRSSPARRPRATTNCSISAAATARPATT